MDRPPFAKLTPHGSLDAFLRAFFIDYLAYERIENDPDEKDPQSAEAWRLVVPTEDSRPFAVAYQPGLVSMDRRHVSHLYLRRVIPHRDGARSVEPVLYAFTDGLRVVFFSADPARNRDDRFDLSDATWTFRGVQEKAARLHLNRLVFQTRLGRKRPIVEFLFEATALSADHAFKRYLHLVRQELMRAVLEDKRALAAVVYHLLESPRAGEARGKELATKDYRLKKTLEELHFHLGSRLGDAVGAAVDTLLLRYVMVRFLEAYHPEALEGLLTFAEVLKRGKGGRKVATNGKKAQMSLFGSRETIVSSFSETELDLARLFNDALGVDVSKAKAKAKGVDRRQPDLFAFGDEPAIARLVLEEEEKRAMRLGGDFYLADLGQAARSIEKQLLSSPTSRGSKLIQDFLGRTGAPEMAQWDCRYEDLRPQTLQDYYESALATAVQLTYNGKTKGFEIVVAKSRRQQRELGAYYSDPRLCRFMVEASLRPLFEQRLEKLRQAVTEKDGDTARGAFAALVSTSICDPTMGSAPFLRSAFDYLSEQYLPICRVLHDAKPVLPSLFDEASRRYPFLASQGGRMDEDGVGQWEWHVLRRMLYGVDIDLKAVCVACQTFALSAIKYLKQGERFPSFFNLNLKVGNALLPVVSVDDRQTLSALHGAAIASMIKLRRKAVCLPNTADAYADLAGLLRRVEEVKTPILRGLVEERLARYLGTFSEELRPFCWELEFPEVFFSDDGRLKANAGFDVMIGNPPWEELDVSDSEFFGALDSAFAEGSRDVKKRIRARLLADKAVQDQYARARARCDAISAFVNDAGWYTLQKVHREKGFRPKNNYFRLAAELFLKVASPSACLSIVTPQGMVGDEGTKALRGLLFSSSRMRPVLAFKERNDIFARPQAFAVVAFQRGGSTTAVGLIDGLTEGAQLSALPSVIPVPVETIKKCSPLSWGLIAARTETDLQVLAKLHTFPSLVEDTPQAWNFQTGTEEINETRGAWMWSERPTDYIMRKGEFTEAFRVKDMVAHYLKPREFRGKAGKNTETWRVVWRNVINEDAERRMLWAIVPAGSGIGHSLNWVVPGLTAGCAAYLVSMMNSFVVEYRARQISTNNNMSHFIVKQLPFPRLREGEHLFDGIAGRGFRLLGDFTKAPRRGQNGYIVYPGMELSEARRVEIQCEVDALVAMAFRLERGEVEHILSNARFHRVADAQKRKVVACFDRLSGA
jgi:hypothetical protein